MKASSPYLFELIKSLTNSEKRYFSLFVQRHYAEDNHSMRLFQIIGKQDQYDEAAAIKKSGLQRNNFAVQKNILYNQILTALVQYDSAGSVAITLQQDVAACQKLLQKGLIAQARSRLASLKTNAAKYEMHETGLQALQIESALSAREQYKNTNAADLDRWYAESATLTQNIGNENLLKHALSKAQKIQLSAGGKGASYARAVLEVLQEAKGATAGQPLTQKARMDLLQTEALYHFMDQDTAKAFAINKNFISLMESQRHWIQFYPQRYFSALNNYLIDCFVLKKEKELRSGLEKMRALKDDSAFKKTADLQSNIFRITYQMEMNYLIAAGQFSEAVRVIPPVREGLTMYENKLPVHHRMNMEYLAAYVLFGAGKYADASKQLDKLQQHSRRETAALIDDVAAIMQVVCHYELGNYSILDSLVKSCKRKLGERKKSMSADLEFDVLNGLLSFAVKEPDTGDWQKLWDKLCRESGGKKPRSPHNDYFDLFNYVFAKSMKLSYEKAWNQAK